MGGHGGGGGGGGLYIRHAKGGRGSMNLDGIRQGGGSKKDNFEGDV